MSHVEGDHRVKLCEWLGMAPYGFNMPHRWHVRARIWLLYGSNNNHMEQLCLLYGSWMAPIIKEPYGEFSHLTGIWLTMVQHGSIVDR